MNSIFGNKICLLVFGLLIAGWVVALVPRPVDGELLAQARGAAKRSQRRAAAFRQDRAC